MGLLHDIRKNHLKHHAAIDLLQMAATMNEAMGKDMDWDLHHHEANGA